jgi:hypothetical protein
MVGQVDYFTGYNMQRLFSAERGREEMTARHSTNPSTSAGQDPNKSI